MRKRKEKPAGKKRQPEKKFKIPRNVQMFIILALAVSLLFVGFGGYLRLFGAGSSAASGGGGSSQSAHSGGNGQNGEAARYSEGLEFTSNGDGTCSVSGIGTCTDTDLIIPPVSPDGDIVTNVGVRAFNNCKSLTSAFIPNSVSNIGLLAFADCDGLTSVTIGNGLTYIERAAFSYNELLTRFIIHAIIPPILDIRCFLNSDNCLFYVPSASLDTYKTDWSDLADRISPLEQTGGDV